MAQRRAAAAEFLVLGHLLNEGIEAYKTYGNYAAYDLVATPDSDRRRRANVQVKMRQATDFDRTFDVKRLDFDFLVLVALNRGIAYKDAPNDGSDVRPPQFWVLPREVAEQAIMGGETRPRVSLRRLAEDGKPWENAWGLIREFIETSSAV